MTRENQHIFRQFSQLYEKHAPGLLFYARKFVSYSIAEDIVHDLFLKIWKDETFFIIDDTISGYLYKAVQNACLNHLKHESVRQEYLDKAIMELKMEELNSTSPDDQLIAREEIDNLYHAVEQLPGKCREVFRLSYFDEKKNSEIADSLGISIRTVEAHLYNALQILRKSLVLFITGLTFCLFLIYTL